MNRLSPSLGPGHALPSWAAALAFVALWYAAAQATMWRVFQVELWPSTYAPDLIAHLLLGALLFGMARSLPRFMLATAAIFTTLTLGNAFKLTILGAPVTPDDFVAARNMFLLLGGWQLAGVILMVTAPLLLLGWMIDWRQRRTWFSLGAIGCGIAAVVVFPVSLTTAMDDYFDNSVWNQTENFQRRGLPIHLLQESARNLSRRETPPTPAQVTAALSQLRGPTEQPFVDVAGGATSLTPQRNLHMIVLESFWDPRPLKASRLSGDPLDPAFRKLWAAAGHSHGLAPVFGGYTANTEFEVLCGFPVTRDNVFFEGSLRRDVPCLPRHLADAGYRTLASHPNAASFWNRVNAYRRIGFQTYWADKDFVLDDMNREFLSDASLYRQVLAKLEPELRGPQPIFNYVLTYFGHMDYPLNAQRPAKIKAAKGHDMVAAYANTLYYKSRELMAFLRDLQRLDPDGLIVLFGDHLPFLGPNFGGFTESGLLASQRGDFTDAMFRTLVATPLIVIDGQRGPVAIGDLPFYQLPAHLLGLLGDQRPSIMDVTRQAPDRPRVRPLPGLHLVLGQKKVTTCRGAETDGAGCGVSTDWLNAVEVIKADLFSGAQHVLLDQHRPDAPFREASATPH
ncbi:LTA synthase family protein [Thiobaca trueperi]|nr:LTA synthase family protein [Thiobaca trueperi]